MSEVKDAYYFPHDSNARNDPNILLLRAQYGSEGYGNYFMIVEMLREEGGYRMPLKKNTYASIGLSVSLKPAEAKKFIDDLVNEFDLLSRDRKSLWSESLLRRMQKLENLRAKRAEAGRAGGLARARAAKQSPSKDEAKGKQKASSRVDPHTYPPTIEAIAAYVKERGSRVNPQRFLDHYTANGWMRGTTPIRDWKAALRTWDGRESDDDAALRKREAGAKKRTPTPCKSCSTHPPKPLSLYCEDCSWCWRCDQEEKDPRTTPSTQLRPDPENKRPCCPDHIKALKAGKVAKA